jgi:hypothetical protein
MECGYIWWYNKKTVHQIFNYEVKLELGVLALNDEITTFQAKKRCPDNTITLTPGILISIYLVCKCL